MQEYMNALDENYRLDKLTRELDGVTSATCLASARRHYINAIKAMGKGNPEAVKSSVA